MRRIVWILVGAILIVPLSPALSIATPIRTSTTCQQISVLEEERADLEGQRRKQEVARRGAQAAVAKDQARLLATRKDEAGELRKELRLALGSEAHLKTEVSQLQKRYDAAIEANATPWYGRWTFWAGLAGGVVVAGGAAMTLRVVAD